jgi:hypothetical protein
MKKKVFGVLKDTKKNKSLEYLIIITHVMDFRMIFNFQIIIRTKIIPMFFNLTFFIFF